MGSYQEFIDSPVRNALARFMNFEFINSGVFFFNVWSIVHLIMGGLLIWALILLRVKPLTRWGILLVALIIWEIFELIMAGTTDLFIFEGFKDIIWDLVIASIGAGIVELIFLIRG